jgi:hypothetical protein
LSIINTNLTVGSPLTSTIAEISSTLEVHVSGGFMPYQYLWNTFAITAVIPINSNGLYWIIATDDLSCPIDTAYYEVTDPSTAVLEFDISELSIYPNPSRDVFNVSFTSETIQDLKVRILNVVGGELVSEDLQQFIGEYAKQIDLSNYAKGIYFLEIKTINGIINKKLMLQ